MWQIEEITDIGAFRKDYNGNRNLSTCWGDSYDKSLNSLIKQEREDQLKHYEQIKTAIADKIEEVPEEMFSRIIQCDR